MKPQVDYILCVEKDRCSTKTMKPVSAWYMDGDDLLCSYTTPVDAWMKDLTFDEVEAILIANNINYQFLSKEHADNLIQKAK